MIHVLGVFISLLSLAAYFAKKVLTYQFGQCGKPFFYEKPGGLRMACEEQF